jgi:hypothetical protein
MQTTQSEMRTPDISPMGLGCPLLQFGETKVLSISGASPGGIAVVAALPEHDLAFAAFGNDSRSLMLHDQLMLWLMREYLQVQVPDLIAETTPVSDLTRYAGTYCSNQLRVDVKVVDGQLEETVTYEPQDKVQERIFSGFVGGSFPAVSRRLVPIREDLFAPARDACLIPRCQQGTRKVSKRRGTHDPKEGCVAQPDGSAHL